MTNTLIELKDVKKKYDLGGVQVEALKGVDLRIKENDFMAIMGPSGSGKSTLMHMVGLLDRPSSGSIFIDGKDVSKSNDTQLARLRSEKIGFVFQSFNLIPSLSAWQNVAIPMLILEKSQSSINAKVPELLDMVSLGKRASHLPSQMSGGERQRVAIARALANEPPIILADEPTGNLDSKTSNEIMLFFQKLQEENNVTIVMVTHEQDVAAFAKHTIHLRDGKIIRG